MPEIPRPDQGTSVLTADEPLSTAAEAAAVPPARKPTQARGSWHEPAEPLLQGFCNRLLQMLARFAPGAGSLRVYLHRARGVRIGKGAWIGYDVVLDTASPGLIQIGNGVAISMRATIIAHFKEQRGVRIEEDVFIGPGAIILPNVVIGRGAVIKAGSVVSCSVPALTIVEGNPAVAVGCSEIPLAQDVSLKEFVRTVRPLPPASRNSTGAEKS
jgi:serine acetyltransferase